MIIFASNQKKNITGQQAVKILKVDTVSLTKRQRPRHTSDRYQYPERRA